MPCFILFAWFRLLLVSITACSLARGTTLSESKMSDLLTGNNGHWMRRVSQQAKSDGPPDGKRLVAFNASAPHGRDALLHPQQILDARGTPLQHRLQKDGQTLPSRFNIVFVDGKNRMPQWTAFGCFIKPRTLSRFLLRTGPLWTDAISCVDFAW